MKLEPIMMIHGGSISDETPMSMSQPAAQHRQFVLASQKRPKNKDEHRDCRVSFIAAPKWSVPQDTPCSAIRLLATDSVWPRQRGDRMI
jgi:hypothetical protein